MFGKIIADIFFGYGAALLVLGFIITAMMSFYHMELWNAFANQEARKIMLLLAVFGSLISLRNLPA